MKFILETHSHAPELNTIHFANGGSIRANNVKTIREAREKFLSPVKPSKYATIRVFNEAIGEKFYSGKIADYSELKVYLSEFRKKHNLPNTSITVKT